MPTQCTAIKPNGEPCHARALPDHDLCLFHHPSHQEALLAARSKGGAAPRRRFRRLPRLLDHLDIAEVLGELLVESMNRPEEVDLRRLQLQVRACALLLRAVGVPRGEPFVHLEHGEPAPDADYLLRVYPALPPEFEALLAAVPPDAPSPSAAPSDRTAPAIPGPAGAPSRHPVDAPDQDPQQDPDRDWTGLSATAPTRDLIDLNDLHPLIPLSSHLLSRSSAPARSRPVTGTPPSRARPTPGAAQKEFHPCQ